jgi:hypothetical protein
MGWLLQALLMIAEPLCQHTQRLTCVDVSQYISFYISQICIISGMETVSMAFIVFVMLQSIGTAYSLVELVMHWLDA